jgi:glycosyltransferase involved in cell wall biosynthesis
MRIAFLGDGSMNHVRRWIGYFHERGHDALLLSFESVEGCPFPARRFRKRLPTDLLGYLSALGAVKRELRAFRPELVNALYAGGYGFVAARSGFRPLVITALGSDLLVDYRSNLVHRLQIGYAIKQADLVTTDAEMLSEIAVSIGAPPERVTTVYFGIDERIFYPPDRLAGTTGAPAITSTRNLWPLYDVATLIKAAPALHARCGARIIVCGDGPQRCRLEHLAATLGVTDTILFRGTLPPQAVADELRAASVYVSTSRSDSTSVSLLEAMACGVPPVVTDIEANREWIEDGRNGFLFPPGNEEALAEAVVRTVEDRDFSGRAREHNIRIIRETGLFRDNMERIERLFTGLADRGG